MQTYRSFFNMVNKIYAHIGFWRLGESNRISYYNLNPQQRTDLSIKVYIKITKARVLL